MRKADLIKNHDEFEEDMEWYKDFLQRVLRAQRVLGSRDDKLEIIESSLIRICALWEAFIEGEMIDCLNIDCKKCSEYLQLELPRHLTRNLCEAVLLGTTYLDFKSVGDIKGFAKKVYPDVVNPFNKIHPATSKKIDEVYVMRNYLSHYSSKSRRALKQVYEGKYGLIKFRQPGDFLFSYAGRRLFGYIDAFLDASKQMRAII